MGSFYKLLFPAESRTDTDTTNNQEYLFSNNSLLLMWQAMMVSLSAAKAYLIQKLSLNALDKDNCVKRVLLKNSSFNGFTSDSITPYTLSPEQLNRLYQALEPLHQQYDPIVRMLKIPFWSFRFLRILRGFPVHPTRESLSYAVALLDTGNQDLKRRALKILQQILKLQDQDPASKTYGVWPKYFEEKPFKILRPDQNWADFLGIQILQIILDHRHKLPPKVAVQVDIAILHAARAIQQRNVSLDYTNIAIMGIYVVLITAEIYKVKDLHDYALDRLRQFHAYTLEQGGFSEYNSPNYTIITLKVLGQLRLRVKTADIKHLVEDLYRLAWEEIAHHFHPSTQQWAGPHSRSYSTLLKVNVLALIERSISKPLDFGIVKTHPTLDEHRLPLPCPPELEPFFLSLDQPRTVYRTLSQKTPQQKLTSYLSPSFCLGTVNYSDFWHQRRPLVAYWGTSKEPNYLRLRCLRDGVDLTSAQFFSVQKVGSVLGGVSFSTDIDTINPYVEQNKICDLSLSAKDLRLRFEFGGIGSTTLLQTQSTSMILNSPISICAGSLYIHILVPYARFGQNIGKLEVSQSTSCLYVDVVLFSGKPQLICLSDLTQAAIGFALQITTKNVLSSMVSVNDYDHWLEMNWDDLSLKLWTQPADQSFLLNSLVST